MVGRRGERREAKRSRVRGGGRSTLLLAERGLRFMFSARKTGNEKTKDSGWPHQKQGSQHQKQAQGDREKSSRPDAGFRL